MPLPLHMSTHALVSVPCTDGLFTCACPVASRLQHSERARQGAEERSHKLQQELGGRVGALQLQLAQLHEQW